MRTHRLFATVLLSVVLALPVGGCAFDEGINVHDLKGTVLVPKSASPTAESVGMIYVGLYSGVDNHLGFPSPVAAPAASTAGADTFPYGGTSLGSFYTRDARLVCQQIGSRTIRDDGANWALDFELLQFPFYEGTNVWAWMDAFVLDSTGNPVNTYTSCDDNNGYYSYFQIEVDPIDVVQEGVEWRVNLEDSDLTTIPVPGNGATRRFQDADGKLWQVVEIDEVNDAINVVDIYSWGGKPAISGPSIPIVYNEENADLMYFGSQYQDVLNFPGKYVRGIEGAAPGDYVAQTPFVLDNLSGDVEITVDFEVP